MMSSGKSRSRSRGRHEKAPIYQLASDGKSDCLGVVGAGVPIIDISLLSSPDVAERSAVAEQIGRACEDIGFFIVVNHGIPLEVVTNIWQRSIDFFELTTNEKLAHASEDVATYPHGYSPLGGEVLARGKSVDGIGKQEKPTAAGDLKEMFSLGPKATPSFAFGSSPRRLPSRPKGFAAAWEAYYDHADALAQKLLRAFALALKLPENWFASLVDRHTSALRANNYPDQTGMQVPEGAVRCSAHTDYGTLTILRSGGPGLQLSKDKSGAVWHDVPFVEDGLVVNLGDLMRRWTNDRWSSTLHRVINPPAGEAESWGRRMAIAYFHNLNMDAVVEPIPSCVGSDRPALYEPIVAGEFLMLKHLASIGKADADAHLKFRGSGS